MSEDCTNCGAALKDGLLSSNFELAPARLRLINLAIDQSLEAACQKCGDPLFKELRAKLEQEAQVLRAQVRGALGLVPILSLQQPMGWSYEPVGIVTAQTVTGTGMFSDVTTAFTDLFGAQSGSYNAKLREGENLCKEQLRARTLELGGNGVVAVDVDYAEVGGQRAMLMVCMTGTAIKITELPNSPDKFFEHTERATLQAGRIHSIDAALKASAS
jgi:uncharacterized protein YbjQ (UPF0145 family)